MKHKYLSLLTLTLVGALLLVGCGNENQKPDNSTTTTTTTASSPESTDPPAIELLSPSANLEEQLQTFVDTKASYQDLLDLVGVQPHIEVDKSKYHGGYRYDERFYKLWYCEGDKMLVAVCKRPTLTHAGIDSPDYYVSEAELWSCPLQPVFDWLENTTPSQWRVSIESDDEPITSTVSDADEIADILDQLDNYELYVFENQSGIDYWLDLIANDVLVVTPYQLELLDGEGKTAGTIEIMVMSEPSVGDNYQYYSAIRYRDGTNASEWVRTDYALTKDIITQLYSGTLPSTYTLTESEWASDYIWQMHPYDYFNIYEGDGGLIPLKGVLFSEFLNAPIDPQMSEGQSYEEYYYLNDAEDAFAEFAVFFLYYDYSGEYVNGKMRPCNWDALVDYLAGKGIEEIGRERGFTVPVFAATIAELEQLDSTTLQDVMGVAESPYGLTVMLSGPTENYNQGINRYTWLPAWIEAE